MKKISIILISYNRGYEIEKTIKSIVNQKYKNLELIIIDGGSSDNTQEIVGKYKDYITQFISEPDDGIYNALNKGLKKISGDIILFFTTGTLLLPNVLKMVDDCFDETYDVLYGNCVLNDCFFNKYFLSRPLPLSQLKSCGSVFNTESTFYSKRIVENGFLFDESYKIASDFDLNLRLYLSKYKFKYIDKEIAIFQLGGISSTEGPELFKEFYKILKKNNCETKHIKRVYLKAVIAKRLKRIKLFDLTIKLYLIIKPQKNEDNKVEYNISKLEKEWL